MTIEQYTYELKKSRLGGFLGNKVAIRQDWIKRTRRYVVSQGLDLNLLATFLKKGLFDRRVEGFNQKALAEPLSKAQQWTLMWIVLSDFGVPEWLRDHEKDEHTPEMEIAEPEEEDEAVISTLLKPASVIGGATVATANSVTAAAGNVVGATATASADATKAVGAAALGVAAIPVKTLSSLVGAAKSVETEAADAIAEAEEVIAEAEATELPAATDLVEAMETTDVPKEDTEVGTSGE